MIQWDSLIAHPDGRVDYRRVARLVSILLGIGAGCILLFAAVLEVAGRSVPFSSALLTNVWAMIVPITSGLALDGVAAIRNKQPGQQDLPPPGGTEG